MAKNDKILLDGIIDERTELNLPSTKRDEVFEYLVFEQILKDYDLSKEEIEIGWVDGENDGGIDGFFILVNGHFLSDPEAFVWPRSGSVLEVWIVTCKHHDTFKQATLDNLVASLSELFNLELNSTELKGNYSEQIIRCRENLKLAYRKLSSKLSSFSINFSYSSRGDTSFIGDPILSRAKQIESITLESFGNCCTTFNFHGATEIVKLHRKAPQFSLELPFVEALSKGERYVLLVNLNDYFNFISDNGNLRRYLFDSNVRDFMGFNRVNEDIKTTLDNVSSPDFWWLNNGITLLATSASVIGKSIQLQDIQIVNGLQTTESIFRHFKNGGSDPHYRSVLIRIIVSRDVAIRDTIIRATNNQTAVELSSLHATDKIQRDIEEILKRNNFFYERRTNFYANQGHASSDIISPLYIASGYLNLILKLPHQAAGLRQKFMKSNLSYNKIFSTSISIEIWPKIVSVLKRVDTFLESVRPSGATEKFLKKWRHITAFISIARLIGKFNFSSSELIELDLNNLTQDHIQLTWDFIKLNDIVSASPKKNQRKSFTIDICEKAVNEFKIHGIGIILKKDSFPPIETHDYLMREYNPNKKKFNKAKVTKEFALIVNDILPAQPWKPGIEFEIVSKLDCTRGEFFAAVDLLIESGLRYRQKDGIVYDSDGNVISFDSDRVNPNLLESSKM